MNTRNSVLKTIIVHKDLTTGIEAVAVLRRLVAQLDARFEIKSGAWQINNGAWNFEMLRDPEPWQQAATAAIEADIIIFSAGDSELPACVRNWIESVLPMKAAGPAALVALLDRWHEASGEPPRLCVYLRRLAEQCGVDFFCNTDDKPTHIESGIESILSRHEGVSAIWRDHSPELLPARIERQCTKREKYQTNK